MPGAGNVRAAEGAALIEERGTGGRLASAPKPDEQPQRTLIVENTVRLKNKRTGKLEVVDRSRVTILPEDVIHAQPPLRPPRQVAVPTAEDFERIEVIGDRSTGMPAVAQSTGREAHIETTGASGSETHKLVVDPTDAELLQQAGEAFVAGPPLPEGFDDLGLAGAALVVLLRLRGGGFRFRSTRTRSSPSATRPGEELHPSGGTPPGTRARPSSARSSQQSAAALDEVRGTAGRHTESGLRPVTLPPLEEPKGIQGTVGQQSESGLRPIAPPEGGPRGVRVRSGIKAGGGRGRRGPEAPPPGRRPVPGQPITSGRPGTPETARHWESIGREHLPQGRGRGRGTLKLEGGTMDDFPQNEIESAEWARDQGLDVTLRKPIGSRSGGGTTDTTINSQLWDIYTPERTTSVEGIVAGMAAKAGKGSQVGRGGVLVNLNESRFTPAQIQQHLHNQNRKGNNPLRSLRKWVLIKR